MASNGFDAGTYYHGHVSIAVSSREVLSKLTKAFREMYRKIYLSAPDTTADKETFIYAESEFVGAKELMKRAEEILPRLEESTDDKTRRGLENATIMMEFAYRSIDVIYVSDDGNISYPNAQDSVVYEYVLRLGHHGGNPLGRADEFHKEATQLDTGEEG